MPGNVIVTIIPEQFVSKTIIAVLTLEDITRIFNRALNTWPHPPQHLMGICDGLNSLLGLSIVSAQQTVQPEPTPTPPPAISGEPDLDAPQ